MCTSQPLSKHWVTWLHAFKKSSSTTTHSWWVSPVTESETNSDLSIYHRWQCFQIGQPLLLPCPTSPALTFLLVAVTLQLVTTRVVSYSIDSTIIPAHRKEKPSLHPLYSFLFVVVMPFLITVHFDTIAHCLNTSEFLHLVTSKRTHWRCRCSSCRSEFGGSTSRVDIHLFGRRLYNMLIK